VVLAVAARRSSNAAGTFASSGGVGPQPVTASHPTIEAMKSLELRMLT
jgi:hypothetical protein